MVSRLTSIVSYANLKTLLFVVQCLRMLEAHGVSPEAWREELLSKNRCSSHSTRSQPREICVLLDCCSHACHHSSITWVIDKVHSSDLPAITPWYDSSPVYYRSFDICCYFECSITPHGAAARTRAASARMYLRLAT